MQGEWIRKPSGETSVVFVHGILSSGEACWRNGNGAYWPDLLQQETELADIGIYVYTYQTGIYSGTYSIGNIVDDLKERFKLDDINKNHQIIFVCHSMGGIVVRKFIIERKLDLKKLNISIGAFLVASPSLGSDFANYISLLTNLISHAQAKTLGFSQDNNWLNDLDKEFKNTKESGDLKLFGKELFEDKPIVFKKLLTKQIVEPFSAARYFGDPYRVPGSDHFSISKPENDQAMQHRLLVDFIKEFPPQVGVSSELSSKIIFPKNHMPPGKITGQPAPVNQENSQDIQNWQKKLIQRLTEHFQKAELKTLAESYKAKLKADYPNLPTEWHQIAHYLVMDTKENDRHGNIEHFLATAQDFADNQSIKELVENVLGYLLQTLVCKCHDNDDQGLSAVPLDDIKSVKLLAAARTTFSHIPMDSDELEHQNGQKNQNFKNIGIFIPETGSLEGIDTICQVIVEELLKGLATTKGSDLKESLTLLRDQLGAFKKYPDRAPIQGIFARHGVGQNPLQQVDIVEAVAKKLQGILGDVLWIYLYGGQDSKDWLHVKEGELGGLISWYQRDIAKQLPRRAEAKAPNVPYSDKKNQVSVFVSYSSTDKEFVSTFVSRLKQLGFSVVMDDTHLSSGGDIEKFIRQSIKDTKATICIISRSSLLSPWVAMEIINTENLQQWSDSKQFIACYLDDDFLQTEFIYEATEIIDKEISEIDKFIVKLIEKNQATTNLDKKKKRLKDHRDNLSSVLEKLESFLCLDIRPASLEASLERLEKDLKNGLINNP